MNRKDLQYKERINDVLYRIHRNLSADHPVKELAELANYSPFHFQRVFKSVTGETLNHYIRRSRLEMAANLLVFEKESEVLDIAHRCGFQSHSSFTHAFKKAFQVTPTQWRGEGYTEFKDAHNDSRQAEIEHKAEQIELPDVEIRSLSERRVAYIRHQGYDRSISAAWLSLKKWASQNEVSFDTRAMIGVHHSNPVLTPIEQCRYLACLELDTRRWRHGIVGVMTIPGGLYACFDVQGKLGDLLPVLHQVYHVWLPDSGYDLSTTPAYAVYRKNQFLAADASFDLTYCIPVSRY